MQLEFRKKQSVINPSTPQQLFLSLSICSNRHSSERPLSALDVHGPATRHPWKSPAAACPQNSSHKKAMCLVKPEALEFKLLGPLSLMLMLLCQWLTEILATDSFKHNSNRIPKACKSTHKNSIEGSAVLSSLLDADTGTRKHSQLLLANQCLKGELGLESFFFSSPWAHYTQSIT